MDRVLITGIDGYLGSNLALALADRFDVLGTAAEQSVELAGCHTQRLPWSETVGLKNLLMDFRPDWVIHCGPTSASAWDELPANFEAIEDQHLAFLDTLVSQTTPGEAKVMVLSSDAVFAGPRLFHEENAVPCGGGALAAAAREVELRLQQTETLIVRTHAYGWAPAGCSPCYVESIYRSLSQGLTCRVDTERHATPILASDLAELLVAAYGGNVTGLLHLSGAERTNPFRLAADLAVVFGFGGKHIQFIPSLHQPHELKLPLLETALNTWRARRVLKVAPPMLRAGLYRFADQADQLASVPVRRLATPHAA